MIGIILTGHGNFATGMMSSVKLIAGTPEHFKAVDFPEGDSTENLAKNLNDAIDSMKDCEGVIVFSDLVGGSPFKTAVEIKMSRPENIEVMSGSNLGMILEIATARTFIEEMDSLCNMAITTGKDQVMRYAFAERQQEEATDGI